MGCFLNILFFFSHFLIYCSFHQPNRNLKKPLTVLLVQEPLCCPLRMNYQRQHLIPQHRTVLPPQQTPNTPIRIGLFRASSGTGSPGASSPCPGSRGRDIIGHSNQRRSASRSWTRDRDVGDTHVGARASLSSRRLPEELESTSSLHHH